MEKCTLCGMLVRKLEVHIKLNHKKKRKSGPGFGFTGFDASSSPARVAVLPIMSRVTQIAKPRLNPVCDKEPQKSVLNLSNENMNMLAALRDNELDNKVLPRAQNARPTQKCPNCKTVFDRYRNGYSFLNREYLDHVKHCGLEEATENVADSTETENMPILEIVINPNEIEQSLPTKDENNKPSGCVTSTCEVIKDNSEKEQSDLEKSADSVISSKIADPLLCNLNDNHLTGGERIPPMVEIKTDINNEICERISPIVEIKADSNDEISEKISPVEIKDNINNQISERISPIVEIKYDINNEISERISPMVEIEAVSNNKICKIAKVVSLSETNVELPKKSSRQSSKAARGKIRNLYKRKKKSDKKKDNTDKEVAIIEEQKSSESSRIAKKTYLHRNKQKTSKKKDTANRKDTIDKEVVHLEQPVVSNHQEIGMQWFQEISKIEEKLNQSKPQTSVGCVVDLPNNEELLEHQGDHDKDYQFRCLYCGGAFKEADQLRVHSINCTTPLIVPKEEDIAENSDEGD